MYNVLIVDDERFILEGLQRIIDWESLGLEVTGEASSGFEAAAKLEREPYDILITDIKMPDMDGLGLLRWVRSRQLSLKCLILSGYDEFDYVKEAITYGIENYLLKPVSETELVSTLLTIAEKLDQDRLVQAEKGADIIRNNILYRWLTGDIEREELLQRAPLLGLPVHAPGYLVGILRSRAAPTRNAQSATVHMCSRLSNEWPRGTTCYNLSNDIIFLLPLADPEADLQHAVWLLNRCLDQLYATLGIDAALTVSDCKGRSNDLHVAYYQALSLLPVAIASAGHHALCYRDYEASRAKLAHEMEIDYQELRRILLAADRDGADRFLDALFEQFDRSARSGVALPSAIALDLLVFVSGVMKELHQDVQAEDDLFYLRSNLVQGIAGAEETKRMLQLFVCACIDRLAERQEQTSPLVAFAMRAVEKRYNENMNLKTLATEFHINPAYFGQLFRKETGESFTNYLNRIRIARAQDLLLETTLKASDVSKEVGYANINYFYTVFKKIVGVSPQEYRAMGIHLAE